MIFVDTNVFMYAVGGAHPLRAGARSFFVEHVESGDVLVSSAEVLQELMHAYVAVGRIAALDAAFELARSRMADLWAVDAEDMDLARDLIDAHPALGARDLVHLSCCMRRGVTRVKTYDRALAAAFAGS